MPFSDQELLIYAIRAAQTILTEHVQPPTSDCETTIEHLLWVLGRKDLIEAVTRLEAGVGYREP